MNGQCVSQLMRRGSTVVTSGALSPVRIVGVGAGGGVGGKDDGDIIRRIQRPLQADGVSFGIEDGDGNIQVDP